MLFLLQVEARKKVARLVLSFVVVFAVCWFPRHIYALWYCYDPGLYNMFWHVFKIVGFCLSFINSCVNPLALYLLSKQFRHYYNRYICCCCRKFMREDEDNLPTSVAVSLSNLQNFAAKPKKTLSSLTAVTTNTSIC